MQLGGVLTHFVVLTREFFKDSISFARLYHIRSRHEFTQQYCGSLLQFPSGIDEVFPNIHNAFYESVLFLVHDWVDGAQVKGNQHDDRKPNQQQVWVLPDLVLLKIGVLELKHLSNRLHIWDFVREEFDNSFVSTHFAHVTHQRNQILNSSCERVILCSYCLPNEVTHEQHDWRAELLQEWIEYWRQFLVFLEL